MSYYNYWIWWFFVECLYTNSSMSMIFYTIPKIWTMNISASTNRARHWVKWPHNSSTNTTIQNWQLIEQWSFPSWSSSLPSLTSLLQPSLRLLPNAFNIILQVLIVTTFVSKLTPSLASPASAIKSAWAQVTVSLLCWSCFQYKIKQIFYQIL